jgi:hypothetical protein
MMMSELPLSSQIGPGNMQHNEDECRMSLAVNRSLAQVSRVRVPSHNAVQYWDGLYLIKIEAGRSLEVRACCHSKAKAIFVATLLENKTKLETKSQRGGI